jgi:general secretion pathway protein D
MRPRLTRGKAARTLALVVAVSLLTPGPVAVQAARLSAAPDIEERQPRTIIPGPPTPGLPTGAPTPTVPEVSLPQQMAKRLVTMDFRDVDLKELIKTMSELTGRNFIIDNRVKGTVTVISPRQLTLDEAYRVFLSVLEINGFTTVPAGAVIKIMPSRDARERAIMTGRADAFSSSAGEDQVVTQIIPLRYADCEDLRTKFKEMTSRDAIMVAYQPTNTLIVTDLLSSIERLMKIIDEVDVEGIKEKLTVVPLRFAAARMMAEELTSVLGGQAGARRIVRGGPPTAEGSFKVTADERTNALIIVADLPKTQEVLALVDKLDVETPRGKDRVHVIYLENALAEDLAKVLTGVIQDKAAKGTAATGAAASPATIIENVTISADKATNSLVITASPSDYGVLESIIKRLDVMRAQVLVEAFIAELSLSKARNLGSRFLVSNLNADKASSDAPISFGGFNADATTLAGLLSNPATAAGGTLVGVLKGFTLGSSVKLSAGALVEALENDADTNILSTPHLLTMDNEEAEIVVGEQRPFLKSDLSSVTGDAASSITKTFDYKDIGLKLKITPHITANKYVRMKVYQEIKDFLPDASGPPESGAIATTNRSASTTVMVQQGETVVIGGLIQEKRTDSTSQVPCLGSIPVLGWAFKTTAKKRDKTNLIILITPHIVTCPEDIRTLTDLKREEMNEITRQFHEETQEDLKRNLDLLLQ